MVLKDRKIFNILSELRIVEREVDGSTNKALGYFKFDDQILGNLLNNYTKPLLLDTILGLGSEIGQLLYVHVDLMLARKDFYERRSKELFQDLGLTNPEYDRQYERKRALEKAVKELAGLPLSTGILKIARIEKTNDKQDYKVIFQKVKNVVAALDGPIAELPEFAADQTIINDYSKPKIETKDSGVLQAEQLVQHFHKSFHSVDNHSPQSKETSQALALCTQYGFDQAKHVIDFARAAANSSNYSPQTFGGILQYTSRAVAAFEARKKHEQKSQEVIERQAEQLREDAKEHARAERRLAALTPEQYQTRFVQAKAELFLQHPFMARQKDGSKIHEGAIRARMIRALESEPMDLLIPDSTTETGK